MAGIGDTIGGLFGGSDDYDDDNNGSILQNMQDAAKQREEQQVAEEEQQREQEQLKQQAEQQRLGMLRSRFSGSGGGDGSTAQPAQNASDVDAASLFSRITGRDQS